MCCILAESLIAKKVCKKQKTLMKRHFKVKTLDTRDLALTPPPETADSVCILSSQCELTEEYIWQYMGYIIIIGPRSSEHYVG